MYIITRDGDTPMGKLGTLFLGIFGANTYKNPLEAKLKTIAKFLLFLSYVALAFCSNP